MAAVSNCNLEPIPKSQVTTDDNHMPMDVAGNSDLEPVQKPQVIYRCKKCRRIVAAQENIVPHEPGKGETCFKWQKRSGDASKNEKEPVECTSIFVDPMKWMETGDYKLISYFLSGSIHVHKLLTWFWNWPVQEGYVQERLQCMGCKARLGYFNWAGMQCSCGAWVNPAFQLHKSRLDECCL